MRSVELSRGWGTRRSAAVRAGWVVASAIVASCSAGGGGPDGEVAGVDVSIADAAELDAAEAAEDAHAADARVVAPVVDAGFPPCTTHADCPEPLACQYWEPGCGLKGACLRGRRRDPDAGYLPAVDGAVAFGICSCDGKWLGNVYTDFPFQRRDFQGLEPCWPTDAGPPPDGCVPREQPNCDQAGCGDYCAEPYDGGVRVACGELLACAESCWGDTYCLGQCFTPGTPEAVAQFTAVLQCAYEACGHAGDGGAALCDQASPPSRACQGCLAITLAGTTCAAEMAACNAGR